MRATPPEGRLRRTRLCLHYIAGQRATYGVRPPYPADRFSAGELQQSVRPAPGKREGHELRSARNVFSDGRVTSDDEINTAGSLLETVSALVADGATAVYSCATHGVFSKPALERIEASALTEVIVTDTIPLPPEADSDRITVLSIAPLFGEAIKRIHRGESVGALFSSEVQLVEEMTFWDSHADEEEEAPAVAIER